MMASADWTTLAESDLNEIWLYIAEDSIDAADRLVTRIHQIADDLAGVPGMGRSRPDVRWYLRSFPVGNYTIYYREALSGIQVLRVLHAARDAHRHFNRT